MNQHNLFEYGIHTENTTHRIHVDTQQGGVVIYKTAEGVAAMPPPISIQSPDDWEVAGYYLIKPQWAKGAVTARGIRIQWKDIKNARAIKIPESVTLEADANTTTEKGKVGVFVAKTMLGMGCIPIQFDIKEIDDKLEQISGNDLQADKLIIQVKFDMGCIKRGLFMQTHERNLYNDF
jgi:hypothetical protein